MGMDTPRAKVVLLNNSWAALLLDAWPIALERGQGKKPDFAANQLLVRHVVLGWPSGQHQITHIGGVLCHSNFHAWRYLHAFRLEARRRAWRILSLCGDCADM
jgi:hypothetical protein